MPLGAAKNLKNNKFSSVQSNSHVQLFATPWTEARQTSLSITNSGSLLKLMSIKSVMPSNHLILCHPLLLLTLIFPSIRVFSNESVLHIRWPKYWSYSFSISPSNEQSGVICFRIHQFDLLAVQGTLKSLLQHHSVYRCHFFFLVIFRFCSQSKQWIFLKKNIAFVYLLVKLSIYRSNTAFLFSNYLLMA